MSKRRDSTEVSPGKGYKWLVVLFVVLLGVVVLTMAGDNGDNGEDIEMPATSENVKDAITADDGDGDDTVE